MRKLDILKQLILADFRERTRRYSFLVTLMVILFFGYLVITDQFTIRFGVYRGIINSAWAGTVMTVASTIILSLAGFYLVKNTLSRDRTTNVGQILAATPLSRTEYLTAKFLSNFLVLALMAAILELAAIVMYLIYGDGAGFNLWHVTSPLLFIALPAMAFVAAMAVAFESIRPLSGTWGNIIYLVLIESIIITNIQEITLFDLSGVSLFIRKGHEAVRTLYPDAQPGVVVGFIAFDEFLSKNIKTFPWYGFDWTAAMILSRLKWVGAALAIVAAAVPFFDRFDRTKTVHPRKQKKRMKKNHEYTTTGKTISPALSYHQIDIPRTCFSYPAMLAAEIRLMLKGYHWFWYLLGGAMIVLELTLPLAEARRFALSGAMILPLAVWSAMGTRETRYNTAQLLYSAPYPVTRLLLASFLAGVIIALLMSGGLLIRCGLWGPSSLVPGLLAASFFVPALALAFGTLSGSKKLFEVTYFLMWYIGGVEGLTSLNFLATTDEAITAGMPLIFTLISLGLLTVAFIARRHRVIL